MSDWREIAVDDILNEVEEASSEGKKLLEEKPVESEVDVECGRDGDSVEVPFCCTVTLPEGFEVVGSPMPRITWRNCLHCVEILEELEVFCSGGTPCGTVDACVEKIIGCIPFIASVPVRGDRGRSNICCSSCLCVDECVRCFAESCSCGDACSEARDVRIRLVRNSLNVCTNPCDPDCNPYTSNGSGGATTVTISGKFRLRCIDGRCCDDLEDEFC